ncbi:Eukaryotic aspartyl protease family protein [Zea mays]|jgi:aspartyl protease family protein|uniref:Eukaryotic aspartyl protease family protein n=1 Tax=Zea mays TaxID=4577 RepID=A0A1D6MQS8_MAIZE|nr:Eukaryotic aspartyl protease family protein [Zea mays]
MLPFATTCAAAIAKSPVLQTINSECQCLDCFEQHDPVFDPVVSSSYRNVTCGDQRCDLVVPPEALRACRRPAEDSCPYYYWYGDQSNTTGDVALESFTVNLTAPCASRRVDGMVFGCEHRNPRPLPRRGGAAGARPGPAVVRVPAPPHVRAHLLVLPGGARQRRRQQGGVRGGRLGAGASATQVHGVHAHVVAGGHILLREAQGRVGGRRAAENQLGHVGRGQGRVRRHDHRLRHDAELLRGAGVPGDSASVRRSHEQVVPSDPGLPGVEPCYNVSGVERPEVPKLSLLFPDGAVWDFPAENYFVRLDPDDIMCLAVLGTPRTGMSIIGNFQQQNFHVVYDLQNNRLGFAPWRCTEV